MASKKLRSNIGLCLCIALACKFSEGSVAMTKYGCPLMMPEGGQSSKTGYLQLSGLNINIAERTLLLGPNLNTTSVFRLSICYFDDSSWMKQWPPGSYCLFSSDQHCHEGNVLLNFNVHAISIMFGVYKRFCRSGVPCHQLYLKAKSKLFIRALSLL